MTNDEKKLLLVLKYLGVSKVSAKEKQLLSEFIEENEGFEHSRRQIEFLYNLNKILINSYSKVSVNNMMRINESLDNELFLELWTLYYQIQQQKMTGQESYNAFEKAVLLIFKNNQTTNKEIKKVVSDEFDKLQEVRNVLYLSMLDASKAEKLLQNCIKRSKLFLNNCDLDNLSTLIYCLKNDYKLSESDLVNISSRCATFFAFSSAQKLRNIQNTVNDFKGFITKGLVDEKGDNKLLKLLDKDFKEVILTTPSMVSSNPESIKETIGFLMGEPLHKVCDTYPRDVASLKGKFTPAQLAKIYSNALTALTITPTKVGNFTSNISSVYSKCYGKTLSLDGFINGRNFSSIGQLTTDDFKSDGKVYEILTLLKPFISADDMQNLLENNASFLIANVEEVKTSLKSAILESTNQEELKVNILHKIKNHFGRYDGLEHEFERKSGISVDKLKKVGVNDLEEEELLSILDTLDTTKEDVEVWKNNWSKEDKELKELQLEIDLENILSQLDDIDEMSTEVLSNIESFEAENEIIITLLKELMSQHSYLVTNNKFNKRLKELDAEVVIKMSEVINKINSNIDNVVKFYADEVYELNESLERHIQRRNDYKHKEEKLISLEKEMEEKNISKDSVEELRQNIVEISKLIDKGTRDLRVTEKVEESVSVAVAPLYEALCEHEKKIVLSDPMNAGKDVHDNAMYMFTLFAKILINESLISPMDADFIRSVPHIDDDLKLTYKQYRELLPSHIREMTDNMHDKYKNNIKKRYQTFEHLCSELIKRDIDVSNLHGVIHCLETLNKLRESLNRRQDEAMVLLGRQRNYQKELAQLNINEIENEIKRLESLILSYTEKMNQQKNTKIV